MSDVLCYAVSSMCDQQRMCCDMMLLLCGVMLLLSSAVNTMGDAKHKKQAKRVNIMMAVNSILRSTGIQYMQTHLQHAQRTTHTHTHIYSHTAREKTH